MKFIKALVFVAFGAGLAIALSSTAHSPCSAAAPICDYELVYNPHSGKLESEYVCR